MEEKNFGWVCYVNYIQELQFFCDVTMMLLRSQSISYFNVKRNY